MQTIEFVTKGKNNSKIVWCTTNDLKTYRDFMQYILDNYENAKDFMIIDTKKELVYDMYKLATEQYFMRKRTFEEKLINFQTGKWNGVKL